MAGPAPSAKQDQDRARQGLATEEPNLTREPAASPAVGSNSAGLAGPSTPPGLGNAQLSALQGSAASPERDVSQPIAARSRIGPEEALVLARNLLNSRTQKGREDVREFKRIREEGEWDFMIGGISDALGSMTHDVTPTTLGDYDHVDALVDEATDAGRRRQWPTCGRLLSEAAFELQRLERQMAEAREGAETGAERAVDVLHMIQALVAVIAAGEVAVVVLGEAALAAPVFSGTGLAVASVSGGTMAGLGMVNESAQQLATRGRIDPVVVAERGLFEFMNTFFGHFANRILLKYLGDWLGRFVSRELVASGLPARALSEGERYAIEVLSGALATPFTTALGVVTARFVGDTPWPTPQQFVEQVMAEIPKGVLMSVLLQGAPQVARKPATNGRALFGPKGSHIGSAEKTAVAPPPASAEERAALFGTVEEPLMPAAAGEVGPVTFSAEERAALFGTVDAPLVPEAAGEVGPAPFSAEERAAAFGFETATRKAAEPGLQETPRAPSPGAQQRAQDRAVAGLIDDLRLPREGEAAKALRSAIKALDIDMTDAGVLNAMREYLSAYKQDEVADAIRNLRNADEGATRATDEANLSRRDVTAEEDEASPAPRLASPNPARPLPERVHVEDVALSEVSPAAAEALRDLLSRADLSMQDRGHEFEFLVNVVVQEGDIPTLARERGIPNLRANESIPAAKGRDELDLKYPIRLGRRPDIGYSAEATMEGLTSSFLSEGKLGQLAHDLRENGETFLVVPHLTPETMNQLAQLAGDAAEAGHGATIHVIVLNVQ
jgi:hypothetical protein